MGAAQTVQNQKLRTKIINEAYNSCPRVSVNNEVKLMNVVHEPGVGCPTSSVNIDQRGVVTSECIISTLQNSIAEAVSKMDAESQAGLGFSTTVNTAEISDEITKTLRNTCGTKEANNRVELENVVTRACDINLTQLGQIDDSCELNAIQEQLVTKFAEQKGKSKGLNPLEIFGIVGGIVAVIILLILGYVGYRKFTSWKSKRDEYEPLDGGFAGGDEGKNPKTSMLPIILVAGVLLIILFIVYNLYTQPTPIPLHIVAQQPALRETLEAVDTDSAPPETTPETSPISPQIVPPDVTVTTSQPVNPPSPVPVSDITPVSPAPIATPTPTTPEPVPTTPPISSVAKIDPVGTTSECGTWSGWHVFGLVIAFLSVLLFTLFICRASKPNVDDFRVKKQVGGNVSSKTVWKIVLVGLMLLVIVSIVCQSQNQPIYSRQSRYEFFEEADTSPTDGATPAPTEIIVPLDSLVLPINPIAPITPITTESPVTPGTTEAPVTPGTTVTPVPSETTTPPITTTTPNGTPVPPETPDGPLFTKAPDTSEWLYPAMAGSGAVLFVLGVVIVAVYVSRRSAKDEKSMAKLTGATGGCHKQKSVLPMVLVGLLFVVVIYALYNCSRSVHIPVTTQPPQIRSIVTQPPPTKPLLAQPSLVPEIVVPSEPEILDQPTEQVLILNPEAPVPITEPFRGNLKHYCTTCKQVPSTISHRFGNRADKAFALNRPTCGFPHRPHRPASNSPLDRFFATQF